MTVNNSSHKNPASKFNDTLANVSIKSKLKLVIMTVSSIAIILAGVILLIIQSSELKENMITDLSAVAEIIAENSRSAISFNDQVDANEVLSTLDKKQSIKLAVIYDDLGKKFASFSRDNQVEPNNQEFLSKFEQYRFQENFLELQEPIILGKEKIGLLYMRSSLDSLNNSMTRLICAIILTLLTVEFLGYLLASYMQRLISFPLISLARLARQISDEENYSLRATKHANDELGGLTEDFNNMLAQVEKRELALRENEKRFQTLVEQAVDALLLIDLEGNIKHVNPSACTSLGYTKTQLLNTSINKIDLNLNGKKTIPESWFNLNTSDSCTEYSDYIKKNGTTYPVEIHLGKYEFDGEYFVLAFARDITQRKEAEETLMRSNDQLEEQVEKRTEQLSLINRELIKSKESAEAANKAKSDFLANMSHEIRTPMNAVMGFTELLGESKLDFKQSSYVNSIQSGARGLMTIINDILDLSKIEAGKLKLEYETVDTYSFIFDIEKIFLQAITDKNLEFEIVVEHELPKALIIDQTRVRQILFNLIGNAIKFTESGYIRINVRHLQRKEDSYGNSQDDKKIDISFTVEDSGIGIEQDQVKHIFEQFEQHRGQRNSKFGGTGLGLTICKNLAEIMNGKITVKSQPSVGSTFTLELNEISVSTISKAADDENQVDHVIFEKSSILLVDDIKPNRKLIREQFKNSQLEFIEAENGLQAVEIAIAEVPSLIIMDIRMPVMDGIEATKLIKSNPKTSHIPIVALTASAAKTDNLPQAIQNFECLLHKPIRKFEVVDALKEYLPYQLANNRKSTDVQELSFADIDTSQLNKLTVTLKKVELEHYKKTTSGLMDDIADFANLLLNVTSNIKSKDLENYAQSLLNATELFDIDNIEILLPQFPILIGELEETLSERINKNNAQ